MRRDGCRNVQWLHVLAERDVVPLGGLRQHLHCVVLLALDHMETHMLTRLFIYSIYRLILSSCVCGTYAASYGRLIATLVYVRYPSYCLRLIVVYCLMLRAQRHYNTTGRHSERGMLEGRRATPLWRCLGVCRRCWRTWRSGTVGKAFL